MDWFANFLAVTPLWLIGFFVLGLLVGASLLGRQLRRLRVVDAESEGDEKLGDFILSSVLGLLALLMGFTFSLAVDRFEGRRALVLEDANAIRSAYLESQLLPEPHRARVSALLVDYTANRLALGKAQGGARARPELLARNDLLITDLWTATVAAFPSIKGLDFSSSYVDAMDQVVQLDTSRKAARLARVPAEVYAMLIIYSIVSAGVIGYELQGSKSRRSTFSLLLLLTTAMLLIVDIDRPVGGGIQENQLPMELLQAALKREPPQVFDRFGGASEPAAPAPAPAAR